nr:Uncharacterised protein [Klebsiella pneumoniae]
MSVRDWNNLNGVGNDFPDNAVNCLYNSLLIKICQAFILVIVRREIAVSTALNYVTDSRFWHKWRRK